MMLRFSHILIATLLYMVVFGIPVANASGNESESPAVTSKTDNTSNSSDKEASFTTSTTTTSTPVPTKDTEPNAQPANGPAAGPVPSTHDTKPALPSSSPETAIPKSNSSPTEPSTPYEKDPVDGVTLSLTFSTNTTIDEFLKIIKDFSDTVLASGKNKSSTSNIRLEIGDSKIRILFPEIEVPAEICSAAGTTENIKPVTTSDSINKRKTSTGKPTTKQGQQINKPTNSNYAIILYVGLLLLVVSVLLISYNKCSVSGWNNFRTECALARSDMRGWYRNGGLGRVFRRRGPPAGTAGGSDGGFL